ncbi:MAG: polysaccharide biosynthesis protein [Lachnospiraceae bacterium]|nr:polysaccharide biosynthesis protein [Lachnospiraceae bacterium]
MQLCNETECKLKVLPGVYQLINEEVSVSKLRDVSIEDLLGRDSVQIDLSSVEAYLHNKTILVTGGGGSIGSELCRQIAKCSPKCLIIFDIYENNAYEIQQELKKKYPYMHLEVLIGSVRNTNRIESVMQLYRPNIVFHAAAHKHVPLMEDSPNEAIKNNVFGTYKTARAADKYGVEKFVLISTDKAVNPTNIMGASKRMCEMVVQMFSRHSKTEYVAVRFGNVLGSNGSVIPLFKKQMAAGGPITVTHPDIIRYFMTIPEAVSLVLQAGAYAKGGEIFVLDMGEPVKIAELAKNLIRLSGYTLGIDMDIEYTGLRPGEKLYEELLTKEEGLQKTKNDLIFIGKPLEFNEEEFLLKLEELEKAISEERFDVKEIVSEIVPTYHIRKEDKEKYSAIYEEFYRLGRVMNEKPVLQKNE